MADKDLTVHLKADDKITPVAKKAAAELKKLEKPIEIDADVSGVLSAFDQVAAEARDTAAAAERLGQALGPELAAKADPAAIVGDLKQMGLTFEQITANADELGAKMRELADADVGGKMGASLGTTRGKMDELRGSTDQTRSVYANFMGNASQDMGALAGVTGSAGVAMGQFAEYATEGNIALSGLLKAAGPMAALAIGIQIVQSEMKKAAETKAFNKERVQGFVDALDDAVVSATELQEVLAGKEDPNSLLARIGTKTKDVEDSVASTIGTFEDFNAIVQGGATTFDAWASSQLAAAAAAGASEDEIKNLSDAMQRGLETTKANAAVGRAISDGYGEQVDAAFAAGAAIRQKGDAEREAGRDTEFYGDKMVEATDATKDFHRELAKTEAERKTQDRVDKIKAMAEATIAAKEAMEDYNATVTSTDFGVADLEGAATAMSKFTDQFYAADRAQIAFEESSDAVVASIKEHGLTLDVTTEAGRANQKAMEDLSSVLDVEFADAYAAADGNMDTFKTTAQGIADRTLQRLKEELGLSAEETEALRDELGLMPEDIETRYQLSGTEEARVKLDLLQGSIDDLPKDVKAKVTQQIIVGDYVGALATVNSYYASHPARLPVTPYLTAGISGLLGGFAGGASVGSTAAPMATATGQSTYATPVYATPTATVRVPTVAPTSITINAGVVGNRFDVDRTVTKALRRHRRLNGERE